MSDFFELRCSVNGAEVTTETTYGPSTNRPNLATLVVPITAETAWRIYQIAVRESLTDGRVLAAAEDAGLA